MSEATNNNNEKGNSSTTNEPGKLTLGLKTSVDFSKIISNRLHATPKVTVVGKNKEQISSPAAISNKQIERYKALVEKDEQSGTTSTPESSHRAIADRLRETGKKQYNEKEEKAPISEEIIQEVIPEQPKEKAESFIAEAIQEEVAASSGTSYKDIARRMKLNVAEKKKEVEERGNASAISAPTKTDDSADSKNVKKGTHKHKHGHKTKEQEEQEIADLAAIKKNKTKKKKSRFSVEDEVVEQVEQESDNIKISSSQNDYFGQASVDVASQKFLRAKKKIAPQVTKFSHAPLVKTVELFEGITVKELAERMSLKASNIMQKLISMGVMATINQSLDVDTASLVADELGWKIKVFNPDNIEDEMTSAGNDDEQKILPIPPVVTVMGHVDHGKTSLLDAIRKTDVAAGESGGITQHIGAYMVNMPNGRAITFIDTPGHEAFTAMRARGASATHVIILVVAADDGIQQQTIEAISHAKAAGVPMIVAINKIDKEDANPQRVKTELLSHEVVIEEMGGGVLCIEVSAKTGKNLDKLEEAILLQADILELKASYEGLASGVVIEAEMDKNRGVLATLIVQNGTLKVGDTLVAGTTFCKIKKMLDYRGINCEKATPSTAVEIMGFDSAPNAGDKFYATISEKKAWELIEHRQDKTKLVKKSTGAINLDNLFNQGADKKVLNMIVKGDVQGSIEAIAASMAKISSSDFEVKIIHSGVGGISESDVVLAKASNALIAAFNVRAMGSAKDLIEKEKIDIRYYSIIYNIIDDVKNILSGMLDPIIREEYLGTAEIRQIFDLSKYGKIAGSYVTAGQLKRSAKVRLLRDNVVIYEGTLKTLKRFKEDVKEVKSGFECGVQLENYEDIKEKDVVECFDVIEQKRVIE